jgi:hypothetical protein
VRNLFPRPLSETRKADGGSRPAREVVELPVTSLAENARVRPSELAGWLAFPSYPAKRIRLPSGSATTKVLAPQGSVRRVWWKSTAAL